MLENHLSGPDAIQLFSDYLKITGVAHTGPEKNGLPGLVGKRLGLINGSSWITLWSNFFGRQYLPGVHLINIGNEAVQINFMEAHQVGEPVPPPANIEAFVRYARDLHGLSSVDAILITCSTMNRSLPAIQQALADINIPIVAIDQPMMQQAVDHGGTTLVIATHGPTVKSTQALLSETAEETGKSIQFVGVTVEEAWHRLSAGDVSGHNQILSDVIRAHTKKGNISSVVLAQLSMSVLLLSYPDPLSEFGIPVFTSGQCGFEYMRRIMTVK